jgi:hypothetical protein
MDPKPGVSQRIQDRGGHRQRAPMLLFILDRITPTVDRSTWMRSAKPAFS